MNELTLDGKIYVSSKRAAEITGYAKDYVGQLCREGRVEARLVGRNWYVLKDALEKHRFAEAPIEQAQEVTELLSNEKWTEPVYTSDPEATVLPIVEEKEEKNNLTSSPEAQNEPLSIEAMQSAWREWFTEIEAPEANIEPTEEMPEGGMQIELHKRIEESSSEDPIEKPLNLRQLRAYREDKEDKKAQDGLQGTKTDLSTPRKGKRFAYYYTLQATLGLVIIIGVAIGIIGTGLVDQDSVSYKPVQFIAGVAQYK